MKKRVISIIIMLLIFIPLFITGGKLFTGLMTLIALLGMHELLNIKETDNKISLVMKVYSYILLVFVTLNNIDKIDFQYTMDYKMISLIILMFIIPMIFINDNKKYNIGDALYLMGSTLLLGFSFNLIIMIRNYDINYLIYLLLVSTITDTFAFITGKLIGKNKLCPNISPGKTVEGMIVGTIMGIFIASSFYHVFMNPSYSLVVLILITGVLSIVGQLGDLVFSMIKRYYKKKDFSNLIPGHGGILDRFDSLIFIVLAFVLIIGII